MTRTTKITSIRPAGLNGRGEEHQVVTVTEEQEATAVNHAAAALGVLMR